MMNEVNVDEQDAPSAVPMTEKHMGSAMERFSLLFGLPHCCKDGVGAGAVNMADLRRLYFSLLQPCTLDELRHVVTAWSLHGRRYPYVADLLDELSKFRQVAPEASELCTEVSADLSDGRISDNELARIDRESGELIASLHLLRQSLAERNCAGKPSALRGVL